jgi:hypothetical protein
MCQVGLGIAYMLELNLRECVGLAPPVLQRQSVVSLALPLGEHQMNALRRRCGMADVHDFAI